jgi:glycogen synthase
LNYGCLPIVSAVGSIPHYIQNNENGFILEKLNSQSLANCINENLEIESIKYTNMINSVREKNILFTFDSYFDQLKLNILHAIK